MSTAEWIINSVKHKMLWTVGLTTPLSIAAWVMRFPHWVDVVVWHSKVGMIWMVLALACFYVKQHREAGGVGK
jgi:hypothetical protein